MAALSAAGPPNTLCTPYKEQTTVFGQQLEEYAMSNVRAKPKTRAERRWPREESQQLLASNIKRLRDAQGHSQEGLAALADFHRTYVGDLERCEQNPTLATLEALADAFKVHIGELLAPEAGAAAAKKPRKAK